MKWFSALILLVLVSACAVDQKAQTIGVFSPEAASARQPVLVELFTAEGCASCPPAERNLAFLQNRQPYADAKIVALAFHVDYWDSLGWKDPFASPLFTQRQRVYDRKFRTGSIYTPQMVVDGDIQFIGSKLDKAEKAITRSAVNAKALVALSFEGDTLNVDISNVPKIDAATVYLAIAEDGVGSDVRRGENAGRKLTHVAVTRSLTGLGRIEPGDSSFSSKTVVSTDPSWKRKNLKAVVFVQENHTRNVYGVGSVRFR